MATIRRIILAALAVALLAAPASTQALSVESQGGFVAIPWEAPFNLPWTNPSYATEVSNGREGLYAEVNNVPVGVTTKRLVVGGFGLQVPSNAKLTGFFVTSDIRDYPGWCTLELSMSLIKSGTFSGAKTNLIQPNQWPYSAPYWRGGETELWGEPLWTAAEVDATSFGVSFQLRPVDCGQTVIDVDHVGVIVYYTLPVKTAASKRAGK